jgi:hypothetical protein
MDHTTQGSSYVKCRSTFIINIRQMVQPDTSNPLKTPEVTKLLNIRF